MSKIDQSELDILEREAFVEALCEHLIARGDFPKKVILKNNYLEELMKSNYVRQGLIVTPVRHLKKSTEVELSTKGAIVL